MVIVAAVVLASGCGDSTGNPRVSNTSATTVGQEGSGSAGSKPTPPTETHGDVPSDCGVLLTPNDVAVAFGSTTPPVLARPDPGGVNSKLGASACQYNVQLPSGGSVLATVILEPNKIGELAAMRAQPSARPADFDPSVFSWDAGAEPGHGRWRQFGSTVPGSQDVLVKPCSFWTGDWDVDTLCPAAGAALMRTIKGRHS